MVMSTRLTVDARWSNGPSMTTKAAAKHAMFSMLMYRLYAIAYTRLSAIDAGLIDVSIIRR